ncbi:MAG: MFS transporter [Verrucomicrobia bacterium]|nr:MFS transporter [Verrucomicrobiota bacterium]
MNAPPTSAPASVSRYAWLVVALLVPVALLNYLDRQMLAAMKYSVMADIPTIGSESNWGFLPAVFKWVYAFLSPVGGYLADRYGRRYVIGASLFVWSAVTWTTGHVHTYEALLVTRALMGISEACYIPAALALIADFHTGPTRSRAVGFHQMAIYLGVMIGGFSGYVADNPNLGWRLAFDVAGVVGILYAIPLFLLLRNPPAPDVAPVRTSVAAATGELFRNRYFILLVLYFTLPALAGWIVKDWMPAILKQQFAIGQGKAGVSATLFVNIASLIGAVVGGWFADRWMRKNIRGRIYVSALGMCCLIPALFGVGNAPTLAIAIAFLMLFGLGWGFFDCNNMPILCQIVRPELRATGYGFMNLISITCGGFADWGFGIMRDRHIPLNVIFGVFASACVLSAVLVLLIRPKATPLPQPVT